MMKGTCRTIRPNSYNLLLVSDRKGCVVRSHITPRQVRWLCGLAVFVLVGSLFHFVGFWRYRSLYISVEKDKRLVAAFEQQKRGMAEKVALLESTVETTEKMTSELAALVGTTPLQLKKGIGPIPPQGSLEEKLLDPKLNRLEERMVTLQTKIQELMKSQKEKLTFVASTPSIWPVKGWVTSDFGYRRSPFSWARDFHNGIDVAAQWGTPIMAPADGLVTYAGYKGGLGKAIIMDHGFGIKSYYGHTSNLMVHEGQRIKRGDQIALVGSTGHATGPHLHYEIHVDGVPVDPMKYIFQ